MGITDSLFVIPARGGSKGLPRKNILPLAGKPVIFYTIDAARGVTSDENICVSTDDDEIIKLVEEYGLKVNFKRPGELASDTATSGDVLLHALDYYENILNRKYKKIILLQPTSPLRNSQHILEAYELWDDNLDMMVSVRESKANPYFNLFEEAGNGYLVKSKEGSFTRRQDCPKVFEFNGAVYIISIASLKKSTIGSFSRIKKMVMDEFSSLDIDTHFDLFLAEYMMTGNFKK
jgi:CMP-N,N'-diacetyllegionaminic acid synthase